MLSILIPTYNYVCYPLVHDLHLQAEQLNTPYEIIVVDDGSKEQVKVIANLKINDLPHCRYVRREGNVGRAANLNYMADLAQGERLLIIDCDAKVENPLFLKTYMEEEGDVIVGGLYHAPLCPDPHRRLRHKYERAADKQRSAVQRSANPYRNFTTFNFMITRTIFQQIRFDKECKEYGYEDTLFGIELAKRSIAVKHIDNPLLHTGIDTNAEFLHKTETALRTLCGLRGKMEGGSRIERVFTKLYSWHLATLMRWFHKLFGKHIRTYLEHSTNPSLRLFTLYKLSYYASLKPLPLTGASR